MKKAPKKDRPGLLDDAARLAEAGRRGDKVIAHITPEEAALLKARGGSGTVNPRTGLLEFYDSSYDGGGAGNQNDSIGGGGGFASDATGGGGVTTPGEQLADAIARGDVIDFSAPIGGQSGGQIVDLSPLDQSLIEKGGLFSPSLFSDPAGYLGDRVKSFAAGLRDAPLSTLGNTVLSFASPAYGIASALHGVVNSQNPSANMLGDIMTSATSFGAKDSKPTSTVGADETPGAPNGPDGFASDSRGGGEQGQGVTRAYAPTPQQTAEQIAQQALRQAIIQPPQAYNTWLGNKMQIPQNPGTPRAYNTWAGNRFQIPGLLS